MILTLSLGFGLGVLAVVLANQIERRRNRFVVRIAALPFISCSPRARDEAAHALLATYQDSTLK